MKENADCDALARRYAAVQEPILEEARRWFVHDVIQDLRCVVRLAVEFEDYLQRENTDALDPDSLDHVVGSILAGVGCFASLGHAHGILAGARPTTIGWQTLPELGSRPGDLRGKYLSIYREFEALDVKTAFERKCRLVLDMFKLQLVFVGLLAPY